MIKGEFVARLTLIGLLIAISWVVFGQITKPADAITIRARMPENGGWTPENLTVRVGQPLHLRMTSDDVVHSFAVGQMDVTAIDIFPGEFVETTLVFDAPGKYIFYCTRWCGSNHWRMRGVIDVVGEALLDSTTSPPLYQTLGIDLDAPRHAAEIPAGRPSATAGEIFLDLVPEAYFAIDQYRSTSPGELYTTFKQLEGISELPDMDVWNLVALIWKMQTSAQTLSVGEALYAENCAACHGEQGGGDGVFANQMGTPTAPDEHGHSTVTGHELVPPSDFTDPFLMLAAEPALLHGKILRGGMGTGMPYWGPIFTDVELWALVDYLWTFQFDW